ncbi:hypothetical protein K4M01_07550 [Pseudomonas syringae pv. tomato]|nr:hypothetical protein [Pseudomonas syringae pv. tomato]MBX6451605.1 hypothetical protein [Pseudomonas syringae pv. tomato]MBX6609406.1 hypothetical protein [Pseudomonas syringae pv. tomato]MBX6937135.1 hypothetical protein [Pseudomonas syringae pv. tomato]
MNVFTLAAGDIERSENARRRFWPASTAMTRSNSSAAIRAQGETGLIILINWAIWALL